MSGSKPVHYRTLKVEIMTDKCEKTLVLKLLKEIKMAYEVKNAYRNSNYRQHKMNYLLFFIINYFSISYLLCGVKITQK